MPSFAGDWAGRWGHSYIYFLQSGSAGPIKIGVSCDPERRRQALQTGHLMPLTLLGICSGGRREEQAWHRRFDALRVTGEWFHPAPALLQAIWDVREEPWEG